jgi:Uma2 family endonuclease
MSPSFFHESLAERLGTFVVEIAIGLRIPYLPAGQTTFRQLAKQGGVESDKSFYFANRARVRGKKRLHLQVDPPPDLVIEAVDTHDAEASVEVWRRFGVPEIWVCDESKLRILIRQPDGSYVESDTSVIFSFLTKGEIHDWITRSSETEEMDWALELRQWIQDVLAPRVRG